MKKSLTSGTSPADPKHVPLNNDIAQCAQELWLQYGQPVGRDFEIWLEAEQRLFSAKPVLQEEVFCVAPIEVRPLAKSKRQR
jgi:hypothetical protein